MSQGDIVGEAMANLQEATKLFLEECPQPAMVPRLLTTLKRVYRPRRLAEGWT